MAKFDRALILFLKGDGQKGLIEMRLVPRNTWWPGPSLVEATIARMMLELGEIDTGIQAIEQAIRHSRRARFKGKELLAGILAAVRRRREVPKSLRLCLDDLVHSAKKHS